MNNHQTDNSFLQDKIALRINHLPDKKIILVLDCFGGNGKVWDAISKQIDKKILIIRLEKKDKKGIFLKGDNIKFLMQMDLSKYDIIDLDAYGVPFNQLEIILNSDKLINCTVFVTFIQSQYGTLPQSMLNKLGYTKAMIQKCPTLFNKNGFEKIKAYLGLFSIKTIYHRSTNRKHYFCIKKKNRTWE